MGGGQEPEDSERMRIPRGILTWEQVKFQFQTQEPGRPAPFMNAPQSAFPAASQQTDVPFIAQSSAPDLPVAGAPP